AAGPRTSGPAARRLYAFLMRAPASAQRSLTRPCGRMAGIAVRRTALPRRKGDMTAVTHAAAQRARARPSTRRFWGLTLGSIGVVFGDIGTSPLYAFREALGQAGGVTTEAVMGVVSLALWALILVVTIKYVLFLMRADNAGEGGVLSLAALAEAATGRR